MSDSRKWFVLGIVAIGQLMVVLDVTIVNVALPSIQTVLGFDSQSDLQWVLNAYSLTFGGFLLLGGRVGDRYGRRLVFMLGLVVLGAASVVGGVAQSPGVLVAARAVQGLAGAFMSPAALSLLSVNFPEGKERNRALGIWTLVAGAGGALGLVFGGVLTDAFSWRWVLLINAPIAVVVVLITPRVIKESKGENANRVDALSAVTVTAGLTALVYALVQANTAGWWTLQTVGLLAGSVVLLLGFGVRQARGSNPMLPLRIFRTGSVLGSDVGMLAISAATVGILFFGTLYEQQILGFSPIRTGFSFLALSGALGTAAQFAPRLMAKVGPRAVTVSGMSISVVGLALFTRISPENGYASSVLPGLLVFGVGAGLAFVSLTAAGIAGVPPEDAGVASALVNAAQQIGGALSLAILTAVANARLDALDPPLTDPAAVASATTSSWAWGFGVGAGLMAAGTLVCAVTIRASADETMPEPEPESVPVRAG